VREVLFPVRDCRTRFRTVPNRKQNFTHTLCSLLSAIIIIAKPPSRHLEKSHNNDNTQPRLTPRSRLLEYCVDSRHLATHRATISSSRTTFKFRLFLVPPSYIPDKTDKSPVYGPNFWKLSLRLALRTLAGYNIKTTMTTHAVMFWCSDTVFSCWW
jgi:hypothetical protein